MKAEPSGRAATMTRLINGGWEFLKLPNGSSITDAKSSSGWVPVDLPHDWLIWQADNLYESADAWYRRSIRMDADLPPVCLIHFDGVYMDCDILLNDEVIDSHAYGYTAFTTDLSSRLHPGMNEVMVHIRHQSPNSRWYSGSGIFRDVTLLFLPESHIVPDSFYIVESKDDETWNIAVTAETAGGSDIPFQFDLLDRELNTAATVCGRSSGSSVSAVLHLPDAHLWSVSSPYLYTLRWQYGEQTGVRKIGIRSIRMDPDSGLYINNESIKLKGVCLHHDLGALGAAFHEKAARRQLKLMQEMGVNALRTSHNPPAEKMLDLCDELGILVVDEAFDMWERSKTEFDYARFFPTWEERDVASWIRRDRCHPSVIMWSIGNEIYDVYADIRGAEVTQMLKEQVEFHDPARHAAVTFGCNYMPWEGGQRCADILKTAGYNYGENLYATHHRQHPDWVIYGSETGSILSSRGVYHFPIEKPIMSEADLQCSALGNSNTSWGASDLRHMIVDDLNCPYSMGQFIWSGIDYIGEPTPYHTRSCYFGQADTACFPKDPYYLFQSIWGTAPVLHIGVTWDWNPGQLIDIPVMTNCAAAELFLNGESLGRKTVDLSDGDQCLPLWKTAYIPGVL
jgi:beta-galactosidase